MAIAGLQLTRIRLSASDSVHQTSGLNSDKKTSLTSSGF